MGGLEVLAVSRRSYCVQASVYESLRLRCLDFDITFLECSFFRSTGSR